MLKVAFAERGELVTRGELADAAGVNRETIRYYERSGLLPAPARSEGNYCLFPAAAVDRVRFIKRAQAVGFALDEIRALLGLRGTADATCGDVRSLAEQRIAEIDAKLAALHTMRAALVELAAACPGGSEPVAICPILDGIDAPAHIQPPLSGTEGGDLSW